MIAIGIFAIVSLLATGGMSHVLNVQKQSQNRLDEVNRLQMFFEMFSRDIRHVVNRPVRGEYGLKLVSLSSETSDGISGIEFTHQGRLVPGQTLSLQRVAYYAEGNKLYKKMWPVLDRAEDTEFSRQQLLQDVQYFNIRYLIEVSRDQFQWQDSLVDETQLRGIKLEISQHDTEVYRIFPVRI